MFLAKFFDVLILATPFIQAVVCYIKNRRENWFKNTLGFSTNNKVENGKTSSRSLQLAKKPPNIWKSVFNGILLKIEALLFVGTFDDILFWDNGSGKNEIMQGLSK